jgi:hypothetical protein
MANCATPNCAGGESVIRARNLIVASNTSPSMRTAKCPFMASNRFFRYIAQARFLRVSLHEAFHRHFGRNIQLFGRYVLD